MANNAYQEMLPSESGFTRDEILAALILRTVYVLGAAEDTQTIDLQTSRMVSKDGQFFAYDSTDTVTAHDGTSCLVDINGRRYKLGDTARAASVLDRTGTPPGSPIAGDAYLVTAGATGAWSGQDDDIAVWAGAAWLFIPPIVGMAIYVEDETGYYHYSAAGAWTAGLGSFALAADAVTPIENQFWGLVSVEDVLDTPPGAPTDGLVWLVGTSPTGDFVGQNDKLAYRRSGAWEFEPPYEGARIYDKDGAEYLSYESAAWAADGAGAAPGPTMGSALATTAGSTADFNIPAGANQITMMLAAVSLSGTDNLLVQLGDSGGIENTGYVSASHDGTTATTNTTGFLMGLAQATGAFHGQMVLTRIDGNQWVQTFVGHRTVGTAAVFYGAGSKTLSAELTVIRLTVTGTDAFDAGKVNVYYE